MHLGVRLSLAARALKRVPEGCLLSPRDGTRVAVSLGAVLCPPVITTGIARASPAMERVRGATLSSPVPRCATEPMTHREPRRRCGTQLESI